MKILLQGPPGIGKSTILSKIVQSEFCSMEGVLSVEHRENERRVGFSAVLSDLSTREFMTKLTDDDADAPCTRVGSYKVDINVIDSFVVPSLESYLLHHPELIYLDEIGRAQAHSALFLKVAGELFTTANMNVLATIVEQDTEWSLCFKHATDVWLISVNLENRDHLVEIIKGLFTNYKIFEMLPLYQQLNVRSLFHRMMAERKYVAMRKLFDNSLLYVAESRIKIQSLEDKSRIKQFIVRGQSAIHTIYKYLESDNYVCDCDLSQGLGKFIGMAQTCSHELAIRIIEESADFRHISEP